jgi:hypothetical protein
MFVRSGWLSGSGALSLRADVLASIRQNARFRNLFKRLAARQNLLRKTPVDAAAAESRGRGVC